MLLLPLMATHRPYIPLIFPAASDLCSTLGLVENAWTAGAEESLWEGEQGMGPEAAGERNKQVLLAEENLILGRGGHSQDTVRVGTSSLRSIFN